MGCVVSCKYIQLQRTVKHVHILQFPKINSSAFNQSLRLNTMLKYVLTHGIERVILVFNLISLCCDNVLSYRTDSHISL